MNAITALVLFCALFCSCSNAVPLNIHVVPHTHDDVGWLKTPDEYFVGLNQSIQDAGVQYILDTVIAALVENPARKFIYVEMAFFYRWWREQNVATQALVRRLVAAGQLEFINGGWTMHDEATVHYEDMVDQMTLGHQFLHSTFGIVPKIGWQLDPFGHSSTSALVDALIGFEALFFARMDYQDLDVRRKNKGLELWWNPSASIPSISLLTGMIESGYCNPPSSMFEYGDDPIQDDELLENYNLAQKAENVVKFAFSQAAMLRHNNVMFSWGCDFMYQNAHIMYKNIEKLMDHINANPAYNVTMFYSTPSRYAEAIIASKAMLPSKTDDFMPYADNPHSYWTGYFVSRSTLKGFVRYSSHVLHAVTSLLSTSQNQDAEIPLMLFNAQQPNGVTTHHDAVSGTEKQHVANDYALNLNKANLLAYDLLNTAIGGLITTKTAPTFSFCPLLNQSICPATTGSLSGTVPIVAYNPQSWWTKEYVRVPISTSSASVTTNGAAVPAQILPGDVAGSYILVFQALVPPLGFNTYFVKLGGAEHTAEISSAVSPSAAIILANDYVNVEFETGTGNLVSIFDKTLNKRIPLTQTYLYYESNVGDKVSTQPSGAYIFRPLVQDTFNFARANPVVTVYNGSLVGEVRRYFQPDLSQIVRLYADQPFIEIVDIIGPIDVSDKIGKEVITRYTTNFATKNTWYSDSNGLELIERRTNYRPTWNFTVEEPVAGNYVPVNALTSIKDTAQNLQLTVVVDRSRSSASLTPGVLDSMLHRRCLKDDYRGVDEPLNETTIMASKEWVVVSNITGAASIYRPLAKRAYHPLVLAFGPYTPANTWSSQFKTDYAPLGITIPPNVQILNFVPLREGGYILRLHHIFQVGEDAVLSQPVTLDIANLLKDYVLASIDETQLTAVAEAKRADAIHMHGNIRTVPVRLQPTEIRTFIVAFKAVNAPASASAPARGADGGHHAQAPSVQIA